MLSVSLCHFPVRVSCHPPPASHVPLDMSLGSKLVGVAGNVGRLQESLGLQQEIGALWCSEALRGGCARIGLLILNSRLVSHSADLTDCDNGSHLSSHLSST